MFKSGNGVDCEGVIDKNIMCFILKVFPLEESDCPNTGHGEYWIWWGCKPVPSWWKTSIFLLDVAHPPGASRIGGKIWGITLFSFRGLDIYRYRKTQDVIYFEGIMLNRISFLQKISIWKVTFVFVFTTEVCFTTEYGQVYTTVREMKHKIWRIKWYSVICQVRMVAENVAALTPNSCPRGAELLTKILPSHFLFGFINLMSSLPGWFYLHACDVMLVYYYYFFTQWILLHL